MSGDIEDLRAVILLIRAAVRTACSSVVTMRFPARTGPWRHAAYCWRQGAAVLDLEAVALTTACGGGGTLAHATAARAMPVTSRHLRAAMEIPVRDTRIQLAATPTEPAPPP